MTPAANKSAGALSPPLLRVKSLGKSFAIGGGLLGKPKAFLHALRDVTFDVHRGETLGLVGESGSGKSTVARVVMQIYDPTSGTVEYDGLNLSGPLTGEQRLSVRRRMQMIFQDPYASLNPRMSIGAAIEEGMVIHGLNPAGGREARVKDLLHRVGLAPEFAQRYPHELSGGQRQRVGIARAIAVEPDFIIGDEAVSALDVSVQAQVLNLLKDLKEQLKLTYIFISHDLRSVAFISDRIAVLYLGRLVELADVKSLYRAPQHPYSQMLLGARFTDDPLSRKPVNERKRATGEIPSVMNPPPGCPFHTRCPKAEARCKVDVPEPRDVAGHIVACHFPG
jgi:oligopeptide transport system ATP-binding protein